MELRTLSAGLLERCDVRSGSYTAAVTVVLSVVLLIYWSPIVEFAALSIYFVALLAAESLDEDHCGERFSAVLSHVTFVGTVLFTVLAVRWLVVTVLPVLP